MDEDKKSDIIPALIYLAFIAALLIGFALSQNQARREFENGTAYGREIGYDEGYEDGFNDGFNNGFNNGFNDGFSNGESSALIKQICRKLKKNKTPETIADELEEDLATVKHICEVAEPLAPEYDVKEIIKHL